MGHCDRYMIPIACVVDSFLSLSVYGVGGFFLAWEELGGKFDKLFSTCTFVVSKVEISSYPTIPLCRQGPVHNGSAS